MKKNAAIKEKLIMKTVGAIITAVVGGGLLIIITLIINMFFSTPPTRAEFETFKVKTETQQIFIKEKLLELKKGQRAILEKL